MTAEQREHLAILLVRLLALVFVLHGLVSLVANLVESWGSVSLAYWQTYLRSEVARPAVHLVAGVLLGLFARPLGRRLAR